MTILDTIAFSPSLDTLLQQVHADPGSSFGQELGRLVERAAAVAKPKAVFTVAFVGDRSDDAVTIDGVAFRSPALSANLSDVGRVFAYVATCGTEFDSILTADDDDLMRFSLDCIKQSALSAALAHLSEHLANAYGVPRLATMNPGSGDVDVWPIEQQRALFSLLGDVEAAVGVRLNDSFLMSPNKTVSGILFPTETDFVTCQLCHREDCPNRRAPFDEHLWLQRQGAPPHPSAG